MLAPSDMTGKVAVVTGAAAGLGKATAERLAQLGADLVIVDIDAEGLAATAEVIRACGRKALELPTDLSDRAACKGVIAAAVHEFGRIDALCNVAGVMRPSATPEMSDADWDLTMKVNLEAPFFLIREGLLMRTPRGRVATPAAWAHLGLSAPATAPDQAPPPGLFG